MSVLSSAEACFIYFDAGLWGFSFVLIFFGGRDCLILLIINFLYVVLLTLLPEPSFGCTCLDHARPLFFSSYAKILILFRDFNKSTVPPSFYLKIHYRVWDLFTCMWLCETFVPEQLSLQNTILHFSDGRWKKPHNFQGKTCLMNHM